MTEEVLVEREGRVMTITMNRPEARNALTKSMSERMAAALDELDADPTLSVAVLTGSGGAFCAGMDLKGFLRGERPSIPGRGLGGMTQTPPKKPIIAAVEGWALAGGCELVLACDLIVAARTARFGLPEVKRGLAAAAGGLFRLADRIPRQVALEVILTGDPIAAERAYEVGLVNRLAEEGGALAAAHELAAAIAANGPLAVQASKDVFTQAPNWPAQHRFVLQRPLIDHVFESNDAKEGASAFAEKREPVWTAT
ncbi:crotonase/enoyl-CoA hydratase family protein [Microbacterium sp. NC79]|uniref:crotonase/enoyl-CoA hydratase family protein n=1 Tax=Microbacterium sp. NC79 TaxID=2851009 RepID=UPI001C2BCC8F|nr:crotonase/enoyl-CoA hydratase family protein [Microbacterium sp. NC79]MBV0896144.1 crotonase/enoyl-CoA hydratase family protein [Microbacterium sp. NC79]